MHNALLHFQNNLVRVCELGAIAASIDRITSPVIDVSDILRAQIVLGVSALDHFIHEIVLAGMVECAKGKRPKTNAFLAFNLPFEAVDRCLKGQKHEQWVGETIRQKHSWQSFQHPEKIADAIRLISSIKLWAAVGSEVNLPQNDVKKKLELIVERRNKIAHEADMDPTNPGFRWPISNTIADDSIEFIEQIVKAIAKVIFQVK